MFPCGEWTHLNGAGYWEQEAGMAGGFREKNHVSQQREIVDLE